MARMSSPVKGYVSSEYGTRAGTLHAGIDIATGGKPGPVHATFAGTVEKIVRGRKHGDRSRSNELAPYRTGNGLIIRNPDGERQLYGHVAVDAGIKVGATVQVGTRLGVTDLSGNTSGHHIHYEEWTKAGTPRNPRASFSAFGLTPGQAPVKASSSAPAPAARTTLKRGMSGEDVKNLQRALNRFKATPDKRWPGGDLLVDGQYGSYTEARIKDLQRRNGLYVDGIAGPKTRKFLGL